MSADFMDGPAVVYCEGAFNTPNGKTAHGLVRFTERYKVTSVIDRAYAGRDALEVLDGKKSGIIVCKSLETALDHARTNGIEPKYFVIGLAPDGGKLPQEARAVVMDAINLGLHVDSGLHDFISDDPVFSEAAERSGSRIRDIRKTPGRNRLHFFTGNIDRVTSLKLAVLGTDSAIGKRTTAWIIVHGLRSSGKRTELIGTGQTAWMQGAKYSMIMDSVINDFVSGEIENAIYQAWINENPDVIVIEGQGSLMNPAYPGGFEILAAGRPDYVILQHAPMRLEYDGFPGYKIHALERQITAIETISDRKVIAVTVNHENMSRDGILPACKKITDETGLPAFDVLTNGSEELVTLIRSLLDAEIL